ncbi:MAG: hypothetical protein EOP33_02115 [Rickettsiaceae bacterium]|nr:MAG: hypothetical protein EOP33_02115 [Rickettsiaceae bacterium]
MNNDIWVLSDNVKGNANQAIALAEEIGLAYQIKHVEYNVLGKLPNTILKYYPVHIKKKLIKLLISSVPPKIIISSGRRTASLAILLKKNFDNQPKIIQIMRPMMELDHFDFIIVPQHDNVTQSSPKIIKIIGALSNSINNALSISKELTLNYPSAVDFVGVIIGGNNKRYKFSKAAINLLCLKLKMIAENQATSLFFSFSRRTPQNFKQAIIENFSWPHIIYDPKTKQPNPYLGILVQASSLICTGDSISMCSEIATTGKPLYIYCPQDFKLKKHRFFIQQLYDIGIAREFNIDTNYLENYSYMPLNEAKRVAKIVRAELFINDNILPK